MKSMRCRMTRHDRMPGRGKRRCRHLLCGLLLLLIAGFWITGLSVRAAEYEAGPFFYLRVRVEYGSQQEMAGLDRSCLVLSSDLWHLDGEYYYYEKPVHIGEEIEFMKEVRIPPSWQNPAAGSAFRIRVIAEAAEVLVRRMDQTGNGRAWFEKTREESLMEADRAGYLIRTGQVRTVIHELEKTPEGEQHYQNDKMVLPGERVSKIVRISLEGSPSELFRKPDPPTGYSPSTPPAQPAQKIQKTAPAQGDRARTGDEEHAGIWLLLSGGSLLVLLLLLRAVIRRKEQKYDRNRQ